MRFVRRRRGFSCFKKDLPQRLGHGARFSNRTFRKIFGTRGALFKKLFHAQNSFRLFVLLRAKSPPFSLSPRPKSCLFEAVQTALRCGFPGFLTNAARSPGAFLLFKKRHVLFSACGAGSVRFRFPSKGVSHGFAAAPSFFKKRSCASRFFRSFAPAGDAAHFFKRRSERLLRVHPFQKNAFHAKQVSPLPFPDGTAAPLLPTEKDGQFRPPLPGFLLRLGRFAAVRSGRLRFAVPYAFLTLGPLGVSSMR